MAGAEAPSWPAAGGMGKLDSRIQAPEPRVLTLAQAESLYEKTVDCSDDPATQKARLEALGRVEALIERYLNGAEAPERKLILAALAAVGAPFHVYEEVLLRGGRRKAYSEPTATLRATAHDFKPLPDDAEKNNAPTIEATVQLPKDYSPFKRYAVAWADGESEQEIRVVDDQIRENSAWKSTPHYMTWRGRCALNALFNMLQREFSIDPDRIYMGGFSVGGTTALRRALYFPDRLAAVNGDAAVPPTELESPLLANYNPIPVGFFFSAKHGNTPPEKAAAFEKQAEKAGVNLFFVDEEREPERVQRARDAYKEARQGAKRDLYAKQCDFASNDAQANRKAWVRIDEYDLRDNPEMQLRIHQPDEKNANEKGAVLENKRLLMHPATVHAVIEGNTVRIEAKYALGLTVFLGRAMVDWEKPVVVTANGRNALNRKLTPSLETLLEEARTSERRDRAYSIAIPVSLR
ncbi:MAG: hypothetical protein HY291_10875 [Planctomycetes bacterium]|nr:hypothetical protein [Planctomycetota bacterium]